VAAKAEGFFERSDIIGRLQAKAENTQTPMPHPKRKLATPIENTNANFSRRKAALTSFHAIKLLTTILAS
jgi:hypothetical protein